MPQSPQLTLGFDAHLDETTFIGGNASRRSPLCVASHTIVEPYAAFEIHPQNRPSSASATPADETVHQVVPARRHFVENRDNAKVLGVVTPTRNLVVTSDQLAVISLC